MLGDLLPQRLVIRALESVREVADATRRLPEIERVVESRFATLLQQVYSSLEIARHHEAQPNACSKGERSRRIVPLPRPCAL